MTNVAAQTVRGSLPLEGLSKHNVNATLFYEKGRFRCVPPTTGARSIC
ncbi:hypothetical protein MOP88_15150 [Sphingomonas sp. WKB10]|nr:hypothetical protein [Sphingomonas sp. WKB10]